MLCREPSRCALAYIVAGVVWLSPRKPPWSAESVLQHSFYCQSQILSGAGCTHTKAMFPSGENAMPLVRMKPSATTRTEPVFGSKRYTWFGSNGSGRKLFKKPYLKFLVVSTRLH